MTEGENFLEKFHELQKRRAEALEELLPMIKHVVNILKDAGQPTSARELEAQLFAINSMDDELKQLITHDPRGMVAALRDILQQKGGGSKEK
jgi:hypothetical protein